ncbi:MAG: hypothetical protein ABI367_07010 [Mucilaginibacter sp.]
MVIIAAFAGLAGALLTQLLTGLFGYLGDRRKAKTERQLLFRNKQIEVAEQFYFMTGETMTVLRKSVEHWKNKNKQRSQASISFFNREIKKLDTYLEKLRTEHWKHNLVGLYFDVKLSHDRLIAANNRSHALYLTLLDTAEQIQQTGNEDLLKKYHTSLFDLCSQYDTIYQLLEEDLQRVKTALTTSFR